MNQNTPTNLLALARQVPACDDMSDDELLAMIGSAITNDDLPHVTEDTVANADAIIGKYKGDPAWDKFLASVQAGPDFFSDQSAEDQFAALIKRLPKNEQEAAEQLEAIILG